MNRLLVVLAIAALATPVMSQTAPPPVATSATEYGAPIKLDLAQALLANALHVAETRQFRMAFAIVEPSGELVAFARMDGVPYGSIAVSQDKATTAARYRTTTAALEGQVTSGRMIFLAVDGLLPVAGGVPIVIDGKVVGAIGVSGASQTEDDEVAHTALAALTVN